MHEYDTQPRYPIRTVSHRTGLTAHVLRAWERRYGAVDPGRGDGGARLYSDADVFRFQVLARLTEEGLPIGRIAALPTDALVRMLPAEARAAAQAPPPAPSVDADRFLAEALESVRQMDGPELYATLMRAVVALPSREFRAALILPLLRRAGEMWRDGRICPAHEHVLSTEVSRVLGWVATTLPVSADAPAAVAVTPSGQRHEFGALLAAIVAAEEGWRVTYMGADLPVRDIATGAALRRARVVLLSLVMDDDRASLLADLGTLRDALGQQSMVVVGGAASARYADVVRAAGAVWLQDLEQLRELLREARG